MECDVGVAVIWAPGLTFRPPSDRCCCPRKMVEYRKQGERADRGEIYSKRFGGRFGNEEITRPYGSKARGVKIKKGSGALEMFILPEPTAPIALLLTLLKVLKKS